MSNEFAGPPATACALPRYDPPTFVGAGNGDAARFANRLAAAAPRARLCAAVKSGPIRLPSLASLSVIQILGAAIRKHSPATGLGGHVPEDFLAIKGAVRLEVENEKYRAEMLVVASPPSAAHRAAADVRDAVQAATVHHMLVPAECQADPRMLVEEHAVVEADSAHAAADVLGGHARQGCVGDDAHRLFVLGLFQFSQ